MSRSSKAFFRSLQEKYHMWNYALNATCGIYLLGSRTYLVEFMSRSSKAFFDHSLDCKKIIQCTVELMQNRLQFIDLECLVEGSKYSSALQDITTLFHGKICILFQEKKVFGFGCSSVQTFLKSLFARDTPFAHKCSKFSNNIGNHCLFGKSMHMPPDQKSFTLLFLNQGCSFRYLYFRALWNQN